MPSRVSTLGSSHLTHSSKDKERSKKHPRPKRALGKQKRYRTPFLCLFTGSSPRLEFTSSAKRLAMQKELNFDPTTTIASQVMSEKWCSKRTSLGRFQTNAFARPTHGSNASVRVNPLFLHLLRKSLQNGKETCFVAATNRCVRGMIFVNASVFRSNNVIDL